MPGIGNQCPKNRTTSFEGQGKDSGLLNFITEIGNFEFREWDSIRLFRKALDLN
jgi:hypothetical protein